MRRRLQRFARALFNWLSKDLFRRTPSGPVGWRKILAAAACVAAATIISLSRTIGAGSLNTVWIEDAKYLLDQALNDSFGLIDKSPNRWKNLTEWVKRQQQRLC